MKRIVSVIHEIKKKYEKISRRVSVILTGEINAKNKVTENKIRIIPVMTCSFNIINWTLAERKKMDIEIWKQIKYHRMYQPRADIERLFTKRKKMVEKS